jgi:mono/diheme cytochrome c family protein
VDDQYGVGTSLPAARSTYLRDALEAVIAGRADALATKATFAPGCLVDVPRKSAKATDLTYFGRAAHILADNCVGCHTPGGVAPFSLATYPDIQGRASMIEAVVRDGLMPPSHGNVTTSGGSFASPRQMTSSERDDLLEWLASDRKLGNFADGPPPRVASAEWAIGNGRPDLLYMTPTLRLPADGPLVHNRSVMKLQIEKDEWVREIEFRPMKPDTVHHALVWILPGNVPAPADDVVIQGLELLGIYSPAQTIIRYPEGVARRLPAGCSLLVDLYAQPMGRQMSSSLRIAMALGERPREEVKSLVVQKLNLRLAPGESHAQADVNQESHQELRVLSIFPYMRARGVSMAAAADGRSLLNAPTFDYRWPMRFVYEGPISVPPGNELSVSGTFNNSASNANNPDPSLTVRAGPGAEDEALMAVLELLEPLPD